MSIINDEVSIDRDPHSGIRFRKKNNPARRKYLGLPSANPLTGLRTASPGKKIKRPQGLCWARGLCNSRRVLSVFGLRQERNREESVNMNG